ncbi:MAG: hypothetical protein KAK04_05700 [Cyclobacteriaceae bacterium]|nr:hypothetical protein [Cyclobacteriaceae bacterium]
MTPEEIRSKLLDESSRSLILDDPYPEAYYKDLDNVKAILLGCDPSNNYRVKFPYVFALQFDDSRFNAFKSNWKRSLGAINLGFDTVYIQNLCRNYFEHETSKNKIWKQVAELWIQELKEELDILTPNIPVLLSSEMLYQVLLNSDIEKVKAKDFYELKVPFLIKPTGNKLNRPLIPFYRHYRYDISKWERYKNSLKSIFEYIDVIHS